MFYVYAYLRLDNSPYYIGKGSGKRAFSKCKGEVKPPKDKTKIIILKDRLDESTAFKYERLLINLFGRKDTGTGILRNKSDGGEGNSGWILTEEQRMNHYMKRQEWKKIQSKRVSGDKNPLYGVRRFGKENPMYGVTRTDEWKKSMSGSNNPMFGKFGANSPASTKCHTPLGWFSSIKEASSAHGVYESTIRRRIKNTNETFKEYYK